MDWAGNVVPYAGKAALQLSIWLKRPATNNPPHLAFCPFCPGPPCSRTITLKGWTLQLCPAGAVPVLTPTDAQADATDADADAADAAGDAADAAADAADADDVSAAEGPETADGTTAPAAITADPAASAAATDAGAATAAAAAADDGDVGLLDELLARLNR